jgi:hypothetical protein
MDKTLSASKELAWAAERLPTEVTMVPTVAFPSKATTKGWTKPVWLKRRLLCFLEFLCNENENGAYRGKLWSDMCAPYFYPPAAFFTYQLYHLFPVFCMHS